MNTHHRARYLAATTGVLGLLLGGCSAAAAPSTPGQPAPLTGIPGVNTPVPAPAPGVAQPKLLAPVSFPRTEIDADDQRGDGKRVLIEESELPVAGHLVVFDLSGKLLGSTPIQPGAHRDVPVTLDPALGQGTHSLRALLTVDDGDGKFTADKDAPVREDDDDDPEIEDEGFRYTVG
ncbi:DUF7282 domain-containing protein [Crossiella sp. CA198]|uniref:DUF7282 domain-containing protein n=1 Tax=Crossiella sp. CA198 TaxID=3455607 RepID=UPI003F8D4E31